MTLEQARAEHAVLRDIGYEMDQQDDVPVHEVGPSGIAQASLPSGSFSLMTFAVAVSSATTTPKQVWRQPQMSQGGSDG